MYLLSYDSWTSAYTNALFPYLPSDCWIALSKHWLFSPSAAKFLAAPKRSFLPHFRQWQWRLASLNPYRSPSECAFSCLTAKSFTGTCQHACLALQIPQKRKLLVCTGVPLTSLSSCSALACHTSLNLQLCKMNALARVMTAVSYMAGLMLLPGLVLNHGDAFGTVCYFLGTVTATKQGLIMKKKYRFPLQSYLESEFPSCTSQLQGWQCEVRYIYKAGNVCL